MIGGVEAVSGSQRYYLSVYKAEGAGKGVHAAARTSSPQEPVQPVPPVDAAPEAQPVMDQSDVLRQWQYDLGSMAGRSRMEYLDDAALAKLRGEAQDAENLPNAAGAEEEKTKSAREVMEEGECQTCKERKYQDGSDDPGVSFKTAAHIDPKIAASVVRGHEMEHVVRERADAARNNRRVISQYVSYRTAICPECGKAYVAGGTTRTTTAAVPEAPAAEKEDGQRTGFSALC